MKKKERYKKMAVTEAEPPPWAARIDRLQYRLIRRYGSNADYLHANRDAVRRTVDGTSSESLDPHPEAGARVTFNMSSVHVPGFCTATRAGKPDAYKNCYDLARETAGTANARVVGDRRREVDASLPLPDGGSVETTYFGAVDVNGTGVRFYGDVCLVLKRALATPCVILDRNSYDLVRSPVKEMVAQARRMTQEKARRTVANSWRGSWTEDLHHIVASKAFMTLPLGDRRWTAGHISHAVCSDEDYIEVLKSGSFNAHDLQEARLSANDIAEDALTASRLASRGPAPRIEPLLWAWRRARAEKALRSLRVPVRVVSNHGRIKT